MDEIKDEAQKNFEKWTTDPLLALILEIKGIAEYLDLVAGSLSVLASDKSVQNIKHIYENSLQDLSKLDNLHQLAKAEKESGYPHLSAQFIISLFSYLDNGVKNMIISMFKHYPEIFEIKELASIEMTINEFRNKTNDEFIYLVYKKYEEKVAKSTMYGVTRFEKLLEPIGFGGDVDKEIVNKIFELARLRNALVHNGGRADIVLVTQCPQLNLNLGNQIIITKEQINKYIFAVSDYLAVLIKRIRSYIEKNGLAILLKQRVSMLPGT
jgi:hypothetical protein